MKKIIYVTGLFGILLVLTWSLGFVYEPLKQDPILYAGLIILGLIIFPFYLAGIFLKFRRKRRIRKNEKLSKQTAHADKASKVMNEKDNAEVLETVDMEK